VDGIRSNVVEGADGVPIHVLDAGARDAPALVLLHGFAQSAWSWVHQLVAPGGLRIVAPDLRGHGDSGRPESGYDDGLIWAADVAAVIDGLGLTRPMLGGWSYGGLVVMDYLARYGEAGLSGVVTVGAALMAGVPGAEKLFGGDFVALVPDLMSDDARTAVDARIALTGLLTAAPLSPTDALFHLGVGVRTPPSTCRSLLGRPVDHTATAAAVSLPWLAIQGLEDRVVAPAALDHLAEVQPAAEVQRWEGIGHAPFLEDPERFNRILADFVNRQCG
jgi:pimeloyl-ACP methyl ester carboxylesterase